ncbi:amidohydrolase [Salicibibacter cibi]|uniref:Amidohydrolase n=1 Tax=Salicibibacter cibi TaxID=2743001 RepID=A0A7T7CFM9_9BACI|nr:M20 family metallopeptidase [Salicibibacter cibi]QQK80330.1 amidohydrolase [Salicibibacter cibi]
MQADTKNVVERVSQIIESQKDKFTAISDQIWEFAEVRFEEVESSECLASFMEEQDFHVERGVAEIPTAFTATSGTSGPVIAILGEFDALPSLSQKAGKTSKEPLKSEAPGHGCGHNLLGVGGIAAAVAVQTYMQEQGMEGTIRYYGCPAEESGYGKTYMVKAGLFEDVDAAFSWHPHYMNRLFNGPTLAVVHAHFTFKGQSSHAAASPELGRSALDAVELMNVGVNYMREHMPDEARVHYAITNTGGMSPNVVQPEAEVSYFVRAPQSAQARELFERVKNIAKGASLMTETTVEHRIEGACSNIVPNRVLDQLLHRNMIALEEDNFTDEEIRTSKAFYETLSDNEKQMAASLVGDQRAAELSKRPLIHEAAPYSEPRASSKGTGSTDVGDVSWVTPTAQLMAATEAFGTPLHTWQVVAQGQTSYAKKGMLYASKSIASTVINVLQTPDVLREAKEELHRQGAGAHQYDCLLPKEQMLPHMLCQ